MIRALLFDIDDTLFSTRDFAERARMNAINAFIRVAYHYGYEFTPNELLSLLRRIIEKRGTNYQHHFNDLCRSLRIKKGRGHMIAAAVGAYHDTKTSMHPYPEVPSLLLSLREKGYRLFVMTAGIELKQWDKLRRLGLDLYFNYVFIVDEKKEKKDRAFFRKILERIRLPAEECIAIGDNPSKDIAPAKSVGMWTVRVRRGKNKELASNAHYEVDSLEGLLSIIEKINLKNR